jgi:hypothetical protein
MSLLFLFIDGVGLGPDAPSNPLATTRMPALEGLAGGRLVLGVQRQEAQRLVRGIDATLGVSGLPQSATGQTTLFTGVNAARAAGFHVPAFPIKPLTDLLARFSVLKRARALGCDVTSANAYSEAYWQRKRPRHSASTLAIMAADVPFRTFEDLLAGRAVYWDITHEVARASYAPELPLITPEEAGRRLGRLLIDHDLVLYETFLPDLAGHRRLPCPPERVLHRLDGLVRGVLATLPDQATLLIVSDHGNLEDSTTRAHTYHPVPLIVYGPAAPAFAGVTDLTGVTPAILAYLAEKKAVSG